MTDEEKVFQQQIREATSAIWSILQRAKSGEVKLSDFEAELFALMDKKESLQNDQAFLAGKRVRQEKYAQIVAASELEKEKKEARIARLTAEAAERRAAAEQREAEAKKVREQAVLTEAETLAMQGRKSALAQWAISNGTLEPVTEDRIESIVNAQRRAREGAVRIESGDGK